MFDIKNKKGFSLIELLICIAILAVLAVIAIPIVTGITENANNRSDRLMAELYTSYMTKYASEEPKPLSAYTQLSDAEKDVAYFAGQNYYPGFLPAQNGAIYTTTELWRTIRFEAITAMKMYAQEVRVKDNYMIEGPQNSKNDYIYYYLSGKVEVKSVDEATKITEKNISSGKTSALENYWICLNSDAGYVASISSGTNGTVFIKLYYYGLSHTFPIQDIRCNPMSDIYLQLKDSPSSQKYYPANTANPSFMGSNIIQFENVPNGAYQLYIRGNNITDLPNNDYLNLGAFTTQGVITIKDGNYTGKTIGNAYNAYLLGVSHGYVDVVGKRVRYSNNGQTRQEVSLTFTDPYRLDFESADWSAWYDSSAFSLYNNNPSAPMYLPFEEYRLTFRAAGYRYYTANVISEYFGIHDVGTPAAWAEPYRYTIYAKKDTVTIEGTIDLGTGSFPLNYTIPTLERNLTTSLGLSVPADGGVNFKLYFKSKDGHVYVIPGSELVPANGTVDGVYKFKLENVAWSGDGTEYDVSFTSAFSSTETKVTTKPLLVDGYDIIAELSTSAVITNKTISFRQRVVTEGYSFYVNSNPVTLKNIHTGQSFTFDTKGTKLTIPAGFYRVEYKFPEPYFIPSKSVAYETCLLAVYRDETFTITKTFNDLTFTGEVMPATDGHMPASTAFMSHMKIRIDFTFEDGTTGFVETDSFSGSMNRTITKSLSSFSDGFLYTAKVPLAKQYQVTIVELNKKCYETSMQLIATSKVMTDKNIMTLSYYNGITYMQPIRLNTSETVHAGPFINYDLNKNGHGRYCEVCGFDVKPHTAVDIVVEATPCSPGGEVRYYCIDCSPELLLEIEYLTSTGGHNFVLHSNEDAHWQECSKCGLIDSSSTHEFIVISDTESTCAVAGKTVIECEFCKYKDTFEKPILKHVTNTRTVTPATCEQSGSTETYCVNCNTRIGELKAIPPLGHITDEDALGRCNVLHTSVKGWVLYCTSKDLGCSNNGSQGWYHMYCGRGKTCTYSIDGFWCAIYNNSVIEFPCPNKNE